MGSAKIWTILFGFGLLAFATSVAMIFLSDHHWYVTYQIALLFERVAWPVQFAGIALGLIGGAGMAVRLSPRSALRLAIVLIAAALVLPLAFDGPLAILNVHSWTISLLLPEALLFFDGAMLGIGGLLRQARHRRNQVV